MSAPRARARLTAWLFIAPLLLVNLLVVAGPGLMSVYYSFTDWDGLDEAHFVGLANYLALFGSPDFRGALLHNLLWTAFFLVVPMSMGLLGAFLLSQDPARPDAVPAALLHPVRDRDRRIGRHLAADPQPDQRSRARPRRPRHPVARGRELPR
ncbi:hypothetical protein Aple_081200 [Acrocarpospora pleiomorpha]|uniref:ABC transmembrane type-1 domain-containing protein n=1 Tax=Acrocarpospora pleiomorpha TaxID=90975 RepID=A0A5M3Y099_9ACTN|nr:hypothetical protein [Acrocarpospora pleiomorpha]GES25221.1 hypothetical protein Aple_081200 [Acrocarpospora pleiomorpha]